MFIKFLKSASLAITVAGLSACQTFEQPEIVSNSEFEGDSVELTLTSPNFSALHAPPLLTGFGYVKTFVKSEFCEDTEKAPLVSKTYITRGNKTRQTKLPVGDSVVIVGFNTAGGASSIRGFGVYNFTVDADKSYKITLRESRPLVHTYYTHIESLEDNGEPENIAIIEGVKNICPSEKDSG